MTAALVMDPNPTVLKPTDTVRTATQYIMKHRYRNLPVVDDEGRYLGVFGVNCLLRLLLPKVVTMEQGLEDVSFIQETLSELHDRLREAEEQSVLVCMSKDVPKVTPHTPLVETLLIMYRNRCSLPVVDPATQQLLGVISYWDVGAKVLAA